MSLLVVVYLLLLLNISSSQKEETKCSVIDTCSACVRELDCVWCISAHMQLSDFRPCFYESQINEYKSHCKEIINPELKAKILVNDKLSTGKDAVQISPQKVHIQLRRGQEYRLNFKYAQAADYPVDLYYVMDLSGSMRQYRNQLSALGIELADTMRKLTKNFRIGFGSFVDKSIFPFQEYSLSNPCTGPGCDYVFKNHLSLIDRADIFSQEVAKAQLYDGGDDPEDGLDALLQAIVCQKEIGWRQKARHLLVFTTDQSFHLAGDGKNAGIVIPHDGKCHMENNYYTHGLLLDFPSIGQINAKALEHGVNIIFAVTKDKVMDYILLQRQIKNSFIKILAEDSSNIVDLIKEFYGKIVDSVRISDNSDKNVEVKYYSGCTDGLYEERAQCDNLHVGVQVNFTAIIKILECPKDTPLTKTIFIRPSGLNEALQVQIDLLCDCDCEKSGSRYYEANATECSHNGHMKCGICDCFPNKLGSSCECDQNELRSNEGSSNCRPDNTTEFCSGLGICKCNKCICQKRNNPEEVISGKYCQCNNYSCRRNQGKICSGKTRGICECGICRCLAGYTGEACECPATNISCISPENNQICSRNGDCFCGKCRCKEEYSGQYCEECESCKGSHCTELQDCVECTMYGSGLYNQEDCLKNCTKYVIKETETVDDSLLEPEEKLCISIDAFECYFKFKYLYSEDKSIKIYAQKERICSQGNAFAIMLIIIGSILLGGLIILIIWKIFTDRHDKKEFAKFEEERRGAGWHHNDNPIFKNATTSFTNPTFNENCD